MQRRFHFSRCRGRGQSQPGKQVSWKPARGSELPPLSPPHLQSSRPPGDPQGDRGPSAHQGPSRPEAGRYDYIERGFPPQGWCLAQLMVLSRRDLGLPQSLGLGGGLCSGNVNPRCIAGNPLLISTPGAGKTEASEDKWQLEMMNFQIAGVIFCAAHFSNVQGT